MKAKLANKGIVVASGNSNIWLALGRHRHQAAGIIIKMCSAQRDGIGLSPMASKLSVISMHNGEIAVRKLLSC